MTDYPASIAEAVARCRSSIDEHWGDVGTNNDQAVKSCIVRWDLNQNTHLELVRIAQHRLANFVFLDKIGAVFRELERLIQKEIEACHYTN